jgi:hypothetical protein
MISILLLDEDQAYAALLARRLAEAGREFSVTANPPAPDGAAQALAGARPACDFVIMGESVAATLADWPEDAGTRFVVLSESPGVKGGADAGGRLYVSRYGRVSSLAALIRSEYALRAGGAGFAPVAGGAVKYIGCFGLGGCCGLSSVAIGIGRDFAAYKGRRVLYLSFESLEAERLCVRGAEGEKHAGDFMYLMLRKREADLRLFLESCLFRDSYGLARFFPSPGLNELARASPNEQGDFLRFFDACGAFDLIVLDLGSECGETARGLIGLCDALVLVGNGGLRDAGKRGRAEAFAREARRKEGEPVFAENMLRLSYGDDQLEDGGAWDGADGRDGDSPPPGGADGAGSVSIGFDGASFRHFDGTEDFVLSGEFGFGIRKLADILHTRVCE